MTLLPLVLSASIPSASAVLAVERQAFPHHQVTACRFCGLRADDWMEWVPTFDGFVSACVLCALCFGLDRPTIESEAMAIWLPEVSQPALLVIVRQLHLICVEHGAAPSMDRVPLSRSQDLLRAWGLYRALRRRSVAAYRRLGSSSLAELGCALVGVAPTDPRRRASLLSGLRLLPQGRFFRNGHDVYPALLATLRTHAGASPEGATAA